MDQYKIHVNEKIRKPSVSDEAIKNTLRFLPAVIFMALIFAFSSMPGSEVARTTKPILHSVPKTIQVNPASKPIKIEWLKVGHFIGYSGLGLAYLFAFRSTIRKSVLAAILASLLYSLTDEFHQTFIPGRHAMFLDIVLDTLAATLSIFTAEFYRYTSNRVVKK